MKEMSSDILGTGNALSKFSQAPGPSTIVDLDLKGLGE
jgi:hypothetical protein